MSNEELLKAFSLRLEGKKWEDIGNALHYSGNHVREQLLSVWAMKSFKRLESERYPRLATYITRYYRGIVSAFCVESNIPPSTVAKILQGSSPAPETRNKIRAFAGDVI